MSVNPIPITAVFVALHALLLVGLSVRVTLLRAKKKIDLLDGGDAELARAIRVQANFVEYVPLALALMGLIELMGARHWVVYLYGIALLTARVLHAWGLGAKVFRARAIGTSLTWALLALGSLSLLGTGGRG